MKPATASRWRDLERVLGPNGASAGCWCMWWRMPVAQWRRGKGRANRGRLEARIRRGRPAPGLLAYVDGEPIGWVAVAPRSEFPRLDTRFPARRGPVWSVNCFYVRAGARRQGTMRGLLAAAVGYATRRGARVVEAYPIDDESATSSAGAYTGVRSVFAAAGFCEVARRGPTKSVMRLTVSRRRVKRPSRA